MYACHNGHKETVIVLIEHGADVKAANKVSDTYVILHVDMYIATYAYIHVKIYLVGYYGIVYYVCILYSMGVIWYILP